MMMATILKLMVIVHVYCANPDTFQLTFFQVLTLCLNMHIPKPEVVSDWLFLKRCFVNENIWFGVTKINRNILYAFFDEVAHTFF